MALGTGDMVTCAFVNDLLPTLTIIKNATGASSTFTYTIVPDAGKMLCSSAITVIALPGQNHLMGGFWAGISQLSVKGKRSDLDQARMQMLQQYLCRGAERCSVQFAKRAVPCRREDNLL